MRLTTDFWCQMKASDIALLERWSTHKDAEAFSELVHRHAAMVYGICIRILRNDADAQDITQDFFIIILNQLPKRRRENSSLVGWLHTIATRGALNRYKTNARRIHREHQFGTYSGGAGAAVDVDDIQAHVDEALASLPEKFQEPVVHHFLEGHSHQVIAENLGVPRRTVTSRIAKGVDEIRKRIQRKGVSVSTSMIASVLTIEASEARPATLVAALGRLPISGAALPMGISAGAGLSILGGTVTMKKIVVGTVALVSLLVALSCGCEQPRAESGYDATVRRFRNITQFQSSEGGSASQRCSEEL